MNKEDLLDTMAIVLFFPYFLYLLFTCKKKEVRSR